MSIHVGHFKNVDTAETAKLMLHEESPLCYRSYSGSRGCWAFGVNVSDTWNHAFPVLPHKHSERAFYKHRNSNYSPRGHGKHPGEHDVRPHSFKRHNYSCSAPPSASSTLMRKSTTSALLNLNPHWPLVAQKGSAADYKRWVSKVPWLL